MKLTASITPEMIETINSWTYGDSSYVKCHIETLHELKDFLIQSWDSVEISEKEMKSFLIEIAAIQKNLRTFIQHGDNVTTHDPDS